MTCWRRMPEFTQDLPQKTLVHFPVPVQEVSAHVLDAGGVAARAVVEVNPRKRTEGWLCLIVPAPNAAVTLSYLPIPQAALNTLRAS